MTLIHGLDFRNLRGDIYGGLTAAVVALPLALAFGVASGAGPVVGLYGAIFVGFFAALFGGTPAQVSGPTGPMTVVMAGILVKVGTDISDWDYLRRLRQAPRAGVIIMLVVLALTVLVDLITAVATGVVLASLLFLKRMADLQAANMRAIIEPDESLNLSEQEREILSVARGRILLFHLAGPPELRLSKSFVKHRRRLSDT